MNTFLEAAERRCSSKSVLLKILQYSELKSYNANILIDFLVKMLG